MKKALKIIGGIFLALIVVGNIVKIIAKPSYENSIEAQIKERIRVPHPCCKWCWANIVIRLEEICSHTTWITSPALLMLRRSKLILTLHAISFICRLLSYRLKATKLKIG